MNNPYGICPNCGASQRAGAKFCPACGRPLTGEPAVKTPAKPEKHAETRQPAKPTAGSSTRRTVKSAVGSAAGSAASSALQAAAAARPWQIVMGGTLPPDAVQLVLKAAGQSAARSAAQSAGGAAERALSAKGISLRGPALQAFGAVALEVVASLQAGTIGQPSAITKLALALLNLVAGLIAGERRGAASIIMLLASAGLALWQGGSLAETLLNLVNSPSLFADLLPGGVAQGLSFLVAARSAILCLKK